MKLRLISLGQTASQEPVTVQLPKPSLSICLTMLSTRPSFSALPCGNRLRWETFAATKSMADAFLQTATQAPQPMQAAASIESSAAVLGTGSALPSGVPPVFTETKPPAWMMRSKGLRSVTRSEEHTSELQSRQYLVCRLLL